ncbi:MAG: primosomal protein N' [Peptococcaceae bacterium]|nr:primosomal protein N' [Peptococcaceae bacterium]
MGERLYPEYAAIIVNRAVKAVDKIFHYAIPAHLQPIISIGMIVKIPFGRETLEGIVVDFVDQPEVPLEKVKEILACVSDQPLFNQELITLSHWMSARYLCPWVTAMQAMLPAGLQLTGKLPQSSLRYRLYGTDLLKEVKGSKRGLVRDYLAVHDGALLADVLGATGVKENIIQTLIKLGAVKKVGETVWHHTVSPDQFQNQRELTPLQQKAMDAILSSWEADGKPVLLHGVTGSGKTEIYLRLLQHFVSQGKQGIFLVPEIALTPQMVDYVKSRIGVPIAVLHSGLTGSERREAWQGIAQGIYQVVIGARSAVFAPVPNLGIIIVDEEHEASYKQEQTPRFHGREVARERCRLQQGLLVLGSATPSLDSYDQAQKGDYHLVELTQRVYAQPLPQVEVVDMREELRQGNRSIFSDRLIDGITAALERGQQALLFLNRRGYHTFVSCRTCGQALECPHCSVSLSYHAYDGKVKCHYCGFQGEVPKICPHCGSSAIRQFGAGTQRVAEEVMRRWPEARVARLDRDVTAVRGNHEKIYRQMLDQEIDILVGTQMIVKGLDFPSVSFVGVIAADTSLNVPDIWAGERTFQLLTQVAGRAGRKDGQGHVVVQTYRPDHWIIRCAARQDYHAFYAEEMERREIAGYPPFVALIRIVMSGTDRGVLQTAAEKLKGYLRQYEPMALGLSGSLLGPTAAPLEKIKDRYRMQMILKGADGALLRSWAQQATEQFQKEQPMAKKILLTVDVDPLSMV